MAWGGVSTLQGHTRHFSSFRPELMSLGRSQSDLNDLRSS